QVYEAHSGHYVGIDLSYGAVRAAAHRHPDAGWLQGDATGLPFPAQAFDVVAFSSVLHHVPDVAAVLAEAQRVLVPGGLVFAFDPNLLHPAMLLFRHPRSPLYRAEGVSPTEQPLAPRAIREDFAAAGFTAIGQRCQSDIPYRRVAPKRLDALLPIYNRADW